jgi:outer membrane protein TolC
MRSRSLVLALFALLCYPPRAESQVAASPSASPQVFTLESALQYALEHYPTIRAALEQVNASEAGVRLAKTGYLPRLDSLWQTNRATANNIFGQLLPQAVIPAMSGPVVASSSSGSVWGSAVGALFSWEPVDFGLRGATVRGAEAALGRARADEVLTRLDVQTAVGTAFLAVVAADRALAASQADVERRVVLAQAARTLADNQLRPGAEAARADAERAAAETRAAQARQALVLAQATLSRLLGLPGRDVAAEAATLLASLPAAGVPAAAANTHPLALARQSGVEAARAQEDVLAATWRPRLFLQTSVFGRGSGANPDGTLDGGLEGLGLERGNWAAGLQVVFPNVFDVGSVRARRSAAAAATRAEAARYDEALLIVTSQQRAGAALVEAARAIAANTPVQLAAARLSEEQARARYQAGLASIVEVADAQNLLAQAEYQDQAARVDVWRALLAEAAAQGTLTPFIGLVQSPGGGR